jgi:hypothetical protein
MPQRNQTPQSNMTGLTTDPECESKAGSAVFPFTTQSDVKQHQLLGAGEGSG